jgi:transcription elongation factor GreA
VGAARQTRRATAEQLESIAERVLGDAGDDRSRDLVEVVRRVRASDQDDLEAARKRTADRRADAHLGEQAGNREAPHARVSQERLQVGPVEAVVPALSQHRLADSGRCSGVNRPAVSARLVERARFAVVLKMDDERHGVARRGEQFADSRHGLGGGRDSGVTGQEVHLRVDDEQLGDWCRARLHVSHDTRAGSGKWGLDPMADAAGTRHAPHSRFTTAASTRSKGATLDETLITKAGLQRATEHLERLKTVGRREIAERIRDAIATETNVAESGAYLEARKDQTLLEQRIAVLEQRLGTARIAEPDVANGVVDVGERVRLHDLDTDEQLQFELVGSLESDPSAGLISAESPVGRALLGRRKGEIAVAAAPQGNVRFRILDIEVPPAAA